MNLHQTESQKELVGLDEEEEKGCKRLSDFPARYVLSLLAFLGFVVNYGLRININIAIVAMVNSSAIPHEESQGFDACGNFSASEANSTSVKDEDGEFAWDESTQSLILGSFFWGYIVTQVPGGRLGEVLGVKRMFAVSLGGASVLTFFTPLAARWDYRALMVLRVVIGLLQGVTFPSMHAMIARWAPPDERSKMSSFIYAGSQAGTVLSLPIAGLVIDSWGWDWVFYLFGSCGLLWTIAWMLLVFDSPSDHPRISAKEKDYINTSLKKTPSEGQELGNEKPLPVPWKSVWTSVPFWAIIVADLGNNWGFWLLLTELPTYMKNMLGYDIKKNGFLSALPYLLMWIFSIIVGNASDWARKKKLLSPTALRKLCNSIAHYGPALGLIGVILSGCDRTWTLICLVFAVTMQGALYSGFLTNHLDLAPNFAGSLFGVTNCLAAIPSFVAPITTGEIVKGQQTIAQWKKVFWIAAVIYIFDNTVYIIFGDSQEAEWNNPPKTTSSTPHSLSSQETKPSIKEDQQLSNQGISSAL